MLLKTHISSKVVGHVQSYNTSATLQFCNSQSVISQYIGIVSICISCKLRLMLCSTPFLMIAGQTAIVPTQMHSKTILLHKGLPSITSNLLHIFLNHHNTQLKLICHVNLALDQHFSLSRTWLQGAHRPQGSDTATTEPNEFT